MLAFLREKVSERKLRLFACSVCRQLAVFVRTEEYNRGIDRADAYADGERMKSAMKRSRKALDHRMVSLVDTSGYGESDEWVSLFLGTIAISERNYRSFPTCLSDIRSSGRNESVTHIING